MKKSKISEKIFKYFFLVSFIAFLTIYISQATGYYEYEQYKKKELTEEQIKKFEQDISEGKEIDIDNYLEVKKNYQNSISNTSLTISDTINKCMSKGIEVIFGGISKMIQE